MTKMLVLLVGLALAGAAQAQTKCWTSADGKRACGDVPPPGARLETPRGAPAPQAPPRPATDEKKGKPAPTPQAQKIRRPQDESRKKTAGTTAGKPVSSVNPQECERAKELLRETKGGGRSKRSDAVKARALADNNCA